MVSWPCSLVATTLVAPAGPLAAGRAAAAPVAHDVASVENLYANDLLARVNAERAARTSPGQPIPPLTMDGGLDAAAQAWADHIASTGVVQDATAGRLRPGPVAQPTLRDGLQRR